MKIALLGYGKMGKTIEKIALERGHTIALKIHSGNSSDLNSENLKDTDVAIDFSVPSTALNFNKITQENSIPTISGTTGWLENISEIETLSKENNSAFLYASNFSLGVNLFFELNKKLAQLMQNQESYKLYTKEIHHIHKLDKPSGTAITLAEQILPYQKEKNTWSLDNENNSVFIDVEREGEVPGTHIIEYENNIDKISISHEAKNREGFALGAVIAAEWIYTKRGVFTMQDVLFS